MAMTKFKYAYTQDQLNTILTWSVNLIVSDDLARFHIRPSPSLNVLFEDRGLGHEAGFEIDAYPSNKDEPVLFYVIQGEIFGCSSDGYDVAAFSPEEINGAIAAELAKQVETEPKYLEPAKAIAKNIGLPLAFS